MYFRIGVLLTAIIFTVGCASLGKDYTQADIDAMQPGVTTYVQAQERLGKPHSVNYAADGRTTAAWVRVSQVMGSMSAKGISVLFDKDGKMIRIVNRQESKTN